MSEDFGFAVEHRPRLLATQYDKLESIHENLVELAATAAKADRWQRGQGILRRLRLCDCSGAHLQASPEI